MKILLSLCAFCLLLSPFFCVSFADEAEDRKLEAEIENMLKEDASPSTKPLYAAGGNNSVLRLMDISIDSLFTAGGSTIRENSIHKLQAGSHDPQKNGFTVQNLELSASGAVDPYLNGEIHLIFQIDKDGSSLLEVEEAFLTTQSLPHSLQIKAGTYFTEFGRINPQHPHSWSFADQPVINTRMFGGDGLRGPGARLSWITPLPWYSEIFAGLQNANGETAFSFLNTKGEDFSGYIIHEREVGSMKDILYSARWLNSFSLNHEITLNAGVSALFGPNATGNDNRTAIYGADLYLKWRSAINNQGFPFLSWQTEMIKRRYEAGEAKEILDDWGLYSQIIWGFKRGFTYGVRYGMADGNGDPSDFLRDRRRRFSSNLTWYPTEFSKIRIQYNYDKAEFLNSDEGHSVWLQFEFLLGSHAKHKF